MHTARTAIPQYQEPIPSMGTSVGTATPGRRLGWRQRLHLLCTERRRESLRRLDALWNAPHGQVWTQTAYSYRDFVIREMRPALRLAFYQHLAMS